MFVFPLLIIGALALLVWVIFGLVYVSLFAWWTVRELWRRRKKVTAMSDQPGRKLRELFGRRIVLPVTIVAIAAAIVLVGWITGRGDDDSSSGSTRVSVLYEVEGTATGTTITFTTPDGGTSQAADKAVPLTRSDGTRGIQGDFPKGAFVYLSAQNMGASGDITCRITVEGRVVSENTASGGYTIATCQGTT